MKNQTKLGINNTMHYTNKILTLLCFIMALALCTYTLSKVDWDKLKEKIAKTTAEEEINVDMEALFLAGTKLTLKKDTMIYGPVLHYCATVHTLDLDDNFKLCCSYLSDSYSGPLRKKTTLVVEKTVYDSTKSNQSPTLIYECKVFDSKLDCKIMIDVSVISTRGNGRLPTIGDLKKVFDITVVTP